MADYQWITFTTDYGLSDGFVAACHGVIARVNPTVRVIDVTHQIPPYDIRRGAAVLAQTMPYLPPAVHVAVVDPGVGTTRRAVAVGTAGGICVGPDNGLLCWAVDALGGAREVAVLAARRSTGAARTFDGRDVFAPVAAHLADGTALRDVGELVDPTTLVRLPDPVVSTADGGLTAEVLTIDRFGNVQLAAAGSLLDRCGRTLLVDQSPAVRGRAFGDVAAGELVVYVDSAGQAAVAVNGGHAATVLGLAPGDLVRLSWSRHDAVE
ncbi:SAM hydrolase/SAM-dependent halogenase family protein [Solwaraspora sp. WMMB335]|uniref:SAM hydrolase/SAM-dependent halogenase family protein n=1 Tax=Solwaraspora sp. WMMB335 TaxID=3404118 RepID=UPI003B944375